MAKSDVLGEFDKYFRIKQGESTIDIPKNKISEALQEQMRAQIKPAEVIETDTFIPPTPMPEPIAQPMPQQQMAPPQPMAQPQMQPQMPREVIQKETIYPQAQGGVGQQINALEQIGHFEGQKALENAKLYNQANDELIRGEAERTQKVQQYQQDVSSHFQDYEKNVNELASAKVDPDRFWNSKSMPQKAAAYIGIVLSGIGAGLTGRGGNSALDVINRAIDADIDAQKAELSKKSHIVNFQGNLLGLMRQKYQDEASAEAATRATMYEKLKLQTQAQAALYDSPIIQQRAQQAIGQLNEQKAKYDQEMGLKFQQMALHKSEFQARHGLEQQRAGLEREKFEFAKGAEKAAPKLNEEQKKAAGFAVRLEQAEKDFKDIGSKGYDRSDFLSGVGSKFPNVLRIENAVRQDQAERNFINAVLRRESGAAITTGEFENGEKQYFPRAGDSPGVLKQKERNRKAVMASMKASSGPQAFEEANREYNRELDSETRVINGKRYKKVPGGWELQK